MEPIPSARIPAESSPEGKTLTSNATLSEVGMGLDGQGAKQSAKAADAGGASGKRRGWPAKATQAGQAGGLHTEQMGLGL
jgi:hypothetical protein